MAEAAESAAHPNVDMIKVDAGKPPADVASLLQLSARGKTVIRSRRYLLEGRPVETAVSYIPGRAGRRNCDHGAESGPGGIYARLEESGHTLERFTEEVSARMPTPDEARTLALPPGVPVFRLVRTAYDADDRPVEVCDTIMASDTYCSPTSCPRTHMKRPVKALQLPRVVADGLRFLVTGRVLV